MWQQDVGHDGKDRSLEAVCELEGSYIIETKR